MSVSSVDSLRPLDDIDKECSSIWGDWYDDVVVKQKPKKVKKAISDNDSTQSSKKSQNSQQVQIILDSISSADDKSSRASMKKAAKLKQEKMKNIIELSKQITAIQHENSRLEAELRDLKTKYKESKKNIPELENKIVQSIETYRLVKIKRERARKEEVFKELNKS